jgi:hypothetical protein
MAHLPKNDEIAAQRNKPARPEVGRRSGTAVSEPDFVTAERMCLIDLDLSTTMEAGRPLGIKEENSYESVSYIFIDIDAQVEVYGRPWRDWPT